MIMQTKRTIRVALLLALACAPATAQDWPTKTTRIIVPFGPASTPDMAARLVADQLQQMTGEPFIVENKPGAGGNLGTDAVAKAAPDGATLGVSIGGPLAINTLLFSHLPYDPRRISPRSRS
jgi:tripartite-type tricarboxylate transporter receptor subunit TctC